MWDFYWLKDYTWYNNLFHWSKYKELDYHAQKIEESLRRPPWGRKEATQFVNISKYIAFIFKTGYEYGSNIVIKCGVNKEHFQVISKY